MSMQLGKISVLLLAVFVATAASAAAATCESLSSLKLEHATITAAEPVAAGAFQPAAPAGQAPAGRGGGAGFGDLPAFCRVALTIAPTSESDIKVEVWLPATGWNGKFQAVGNGGWNGNIDRNALAAGLRRGYASASTDTGHTGGGGPWMQNPEKLADFGYRAVHEMAVKGKAIVAAFYDAPPKLSYFTGCSAGGRQGMKAAQRYPADFDGIVAGAPAVNTTGRAVFSMYIAQELRKSEGSYIPASKYPAIHEAVLQACDARDGATDRSIENPNRCSFDPQVLLCKGTDSDSCLTAPQVEATRAMYQAVTNPRTKKSIFPGLSYGSEPGWSTFGGQQPFGIGAQMFQYMVFKDQSWDFKTLNFDSHMDLVDTIEKGAINALDPNLRPFIARGGKLIQYHGWADPQIPASSSTQYYDSVVNAMGGADRVKDNYRLFMIPGMAHCGGGTGTATFDMLTALEAWVEQGKAPAQIPASRVVNGKTDRTRPLCPYPQVATYKGSGSVDDAANFVCK
jgi:feruloyl esterase